MATFEEIGLADFGTFDILQDEKVRQGIKVYSNWPTFPQVYINSKLIGGLDVIKELIEEDEFNDLLPEAQKRKNKKWKIQQHR
eukprot:UN32954